MLKLSKIIWHDGRVLETSGETLKVLIENFSSCSECHAKGACLVSDKKEKIIEVDRSNELFCVGEKVVVYFEEKLGFLALGLGYVIPFFLLLGTLFLSFELSRNELLSGFFSIAILVPYYFLLYILRHKIKKVFEFRVERNK